MTERRRLQRGWREDDGRRKPVGWERQEAKLPELQSSGRAQRGSGSQKGASHKGDSTGDLFLVSGKTTEKKTIPLELGWLEEIARQAANVRLHPALTFGFDGLGALSSGSVNWCAFEFDTAKALIAVTEAVLAGDLDRARTLADLIRRG